MSFRAAQAKLRFCFSLLWIALWSIPSFAAGKKPYSAPPVHFTKRIVRFESVRPAWIELPDGQWRDLTEGLRSRVQTELIQSGKFTVEFPENIGAMMADSMEAKKACGPQDWWWNSTGALTGKVQFEVKEFSFLTGDRGGRMFYGFNERFKTPFNDGSQVTPNEFPMRLIESVPNWFDRSFDQKGRGILHSRTGLDLGEGFRIDAWAAYFALNYAKYQSKMIAEVTITRGGSSDQKNKTEGDAYPKQVERIEVTGEGRFFDFSGGYDRYSLGIQVARRTAILQVFEKMSVALAGRSSAVLEKIPLRASLDGWIDQCGVRYYLLGTGLDSTQLEGKIFYQEDQPDRKMKIVRTTASGSVALPLGDEESFEVGTVWSEFVSGPESERKNTLEAGGTLALTTADKITEEQEPPRVSIRLPSANLNREPLYQVQTPQERFTAFTRSILESAFLPIRIARYFQYDQPVKAEALAPIGQNKIRVAIIDSGVDYNHPKLRGKIWQKETKGEEGIFETKDSSPIEVGWDFISGDARPYDDGYTGTQMAGLVSSEEVEIMPLKVFNPFGITSSAAVYAAFEYAIKNGANLILLGAGTRRESKALKEGIRLAEMNGVWVVVPAGDRGFDLEKEKNFPAAWAEDFQNILVVAALKGDSSGKAIDQLVEKSGRYSNFSSRWADLGALGESVPVIEPRNGYSTETGTRIAASNAAAALVRFLSKNGFASSSYLKEGMDRHGGEYDFKSVKQKFLMDYTISSDRLAEKIKGGRILTE